MNKKICVKKNVYLKDAPEDVQQTLRELGFDETFDSGQTFGDFLKKKGIDVECIEENLDKKGENLWNLKNINMLVD